MGSIAVGADGVVEPHAIPALEADYFAARLEGNEFILTEQQFAAPSPGDDVFIQLEAKIGHAKWFQTIDEEGDPIPKAEVHARWENEGVPYEKTVIGREDGYVMVPGLPEGSITGTVTAKERALTTLDPILVPQDPPQVLIVTLLRGSSLRGRCLRGIEPVRDFELRYWSVNDSRARGAQTIIGSTEGEFLIENLPSSRVVLAAISPEFERSEPLIVDLTDARQNEPVLQLLSPSSIVGHVVDGRSRSPITNATITVYSNQ